MGIRSEIWTATGSWFIQIIDVEDAQLCMGHWRVFFLLHLEGQSMRKG
ncbi:hypothetical protein [Paenibacillus sp. UNC217MF]|nr:hypothetical protein [Paenibacillus sp. UNC217MF]